MSYENEREERHFHQQVLKLLMSIESTLKQILAGEKPTGPGPAVEFKILIGGNTAMATTPTIISDSQPTAVAVLGIDSVGVLGASLPTGATIAVTTDNAAVASFTADATPQPQPQPGGTSVPSLISGDLVPASPVLANTTANVSFAITNADGSAGATGSASFQLGAGAAVSEQIVFGAPVAGPVSAARKASLKR